MRSVLIVGVMCCSMSGLSAADLFLRGDVDGSGGRNVSDAVVLLGHLFSGGEIPCEDAADSDDSGSLSITDPIYLLNYLFSSGIAPPFPLTHCSVDVTEDALGCESFSACEPAIPFYTTVLSGDAFIFVIDRSGSMQDSGELSRAKQEVSSFAEKLPVGSQVAVVVFDAGLLAFPEGEAPVLVDKGSRSAFTSWLNDVPPGSASCFRQGMERALDFAENSMGAVHIVYVGDGGGTCFGQNERSHLVEMLNVITKRNAGHAQITTVGVLMGDVRVMQREFLELLAARNGGRYIGVN